MGFFREVAINCGSEAVQFAKSYAKTNIRLAKLRNRRIFLLKCRRHGVIPDHITQGSSNLLQLITTQPGRTAWAIDRFTQRLKSKTLNFEIKITNNNITHAERLLSNVEYQLKQRIPEEWLHQFKRKQLISYNIMFHKIKTINCNKFNKLKSHRTGTLYTKESWIVNLSNVIIPKEVSEFLALGPKFSIPFSSKEFPYFKFMANIESIVKECQQEKQDVMRAKITNVMTNFFQSQSMTRKSELLKLFYRSKLFLRNNPQIFVTKADKGNVTVVLDKAQYRDRMNTLLSDENTYSRLNRDPTSSIQRRNNDMVKKMKVMKLVDDTGAKKLSTYKANAPRIYGTPKIHKPGCPLRPIVSSINSPVENLSEFMADILTKSITTNNEYYVRDSFHFADFINNFQLPDNYMLVSLDVVSLFSNISLPLVITGINKKWDRIAPVCGCSREFFLELVEFVFQSSYFVFDSVYYKQNLGCPMGSKLSPVLALLVMDLLLDECIPRLPFNLPFIKKYVDDIICAIPTNRTREILDVFNGYDQFIKFTAEEEDQREHSVPFLDTKLIRTTDDNKIILDWYQKPTASGRYINFWSNHPMKMKINLVLALKNRISAISHPSRRLNNMKRLHSLMLDNSYPARLVNRLIFSTPNSGRELNRTNNNRMTPNEDMRIYRTLPYVDHLSHRITKLIKLYNNNLIIAYNSPLCIKNIMTTCKDRIELLNNIDIVYEIPCGDCDRVYIGQTAQKLKSRITQHKSDTKIKSKNNSCALATHASSKKHNIDYDKIKILTHENNYFNRAILEMLYIQREPRAMNSKSDMKGLSNAYAFLLQLTGRFGHNKK